MVNLRKSIELESRYVLAVGVVGADSKGKVEDAMQHSKEDQASRKLSEEITGTGFQPARDWVLDVSRTTEGRYHLLEIAAFSFANLYTRDKRAVVDAVSTAAVSNRKTINT